MTQVVGPELLDLCRAWGQSSFASSYYLAGGTALALQIGHRRSVDLDWFPRSADERVPAEGIARELDRLFGPEHVQPVRRQIDQATWTIKGIRARLFLEQLVYLSDLEDIDATLCLVREPVTLREIEAFLRGRVAAFVRRQAEGGAGS